MRSGITLVRKISSLTWRLYEYVATYTGLAALGALCLSWLPFAAIFHIVLPSQIGHVLGRRVIMLGFRTYLTFLQAVCGCRVNLSELDKLGQQGPMVIVANHPSLLDAVMITSRLPNAVCVMKSSLMDNLLFGAAARLAGYVRNDIPLTMILESVDVVQRGGQLVIFPEGTRTTCPPMNPCLPVIGVLAERCAVPVQTLIIDFSTVYLGKNWPLWQPPSLPLSFGARLGRRFEPPSNANVFNGELEEYFQSELNTSSKKLST